MPFKCINVDTPTSKSVMDKRVTEETRNKQKKGKCIGGKSRKERKSKEKNDYRAKNKKKYEDLVTDGTWYKK